MGTCRHYPAFSLVFYVFMLESCFTLANRGMLLQEPNNNWKRWVPEFRGTSWSSLIYLGEPVFASCSVGSSNEEWLLSPFIQIPSSVRSLNVKFNYTVQNCSSFNKPPSTCHETIQLLKREESKPVRISELRRRRFDILTNFTPSDGELVTTRPVSAGPKSTFISTIKTQARGAYLAIKNVGVCVALFSFELSHGTCSPRVVNLVKLNTTAAPAIGSQGIEVNGSCVDHAVPAPSSLRLYALCHSNGEWTAGVNVSCVCTAGYQENTAKNICEECPKGTFKEGADNELCRNCSAKSVPNINKTGCECIENYFRIPGEPDCTGKPSAPRKLRVTSLSGREVTLVWEEPTDTGGRDDVVYDIYCRFIRFPGNRYKDCPPTVEYKPRNKSLVQKKVTLSNLRPFTSYEIIVASRNGASDFLSETILAQSSLDLMTYPSDTTDERLRCYTCISTTSWDHCDSQSRPVTCPARSNRCAKTSFELIQAGLRLKTFVKGCSSQEVCQRNTHPVCQQVLTTSFKCEVFCCDRKLCNGKPRTEAPCKGATPIKDPRTGQDLFCGRGPKHTKCPPDSYCDVHAADAFSKCCPLNATFTAKLPSTTITTAPSTVATTMPILLGCGGRLTWTRGQISSPSYPRSYPANARCRWIISLPKHFYVIALTLREVYLEDDRNCMYDYIMFLDALHNQVGSRHCGRLVKPLTIDIYGNAAIIVFRSDGTNNKRGFFITYRAYHR